MKPAAAPPISLSGDLDAYALPDVELAFARAEGRHVIIDLRDARTVSAAFFGALVRLRKRLPDSRIEVIGANAGVRRVFRIVHAEALVVVS